MPDADRLTPADPSDLADAIAFALRYSGRKRTHDAGEIMAAIVAKRLVEHLERSGFVFMKSHRSAAVPRILSGVVKGEAVAAGMNAGKGVGQLPDPSSRAKGPGAPGPVCR